MVGYHEFHLCESNLSDLFEGIVRFIENSGEIMYCLFNMVYGI